MKFVVRLLILSILVLPFFANAQSSRQAEKKTKKLEKLKEQRKREEQKNYEKALKEHYKMQSPETRKMMKATFRKSLRESENRPTFFLHRWYDNVFHKRKLRENQQNKGSTPKPKL